MLCCFTCYNSLKGLFQRFSLALKYCILLMHISTALFDFLFCSIWALSPFLLIYELSLCLQIFLFGTNSFKSPGTIPFWLKSIKVEQLLVPVMQDTLLDPRELLRVGQLSVFPVTRVKNVCQCERRWYLPWCDWAELTLVWLQRSWGEWA